MTAPARHTEHGNGEIARAGEILRTVVGSGVHGIAVDLLAVQRGCVPRPDPETVTAGAVDARRRHGGWA